MQFDGQILSHQAQCGNLRLQSTSNTTFTPCIKVKIGLVRHHTSRQIGIRSSSNREASQPYDIV